MAHPIPYQGSKRRLADAILSTVRGPFRRFYEPFAGSAAVTLAAARAGLAERYVIADSLTPLAALWRAIVDAPDPLADAYERLWRGQRPGDALYYNRVRLYYNRDGDPAKLLYLLARCVKNAPRWNRDGRFNQSADRRRLGARPDKMRREIAAASSLLAGRSAIVAADFEAALADAGPDDLVYLDPPWEGVTVGGDPRYHQGLGRERLLDALSRLDERRVPFLLSYDGRCGERSYGAPLPASLGLERRELCAGRSSQSTLSGRAEQTYESLYLSRALREMAWIRRIYAF